LVHSVVYGWKTKILNIVMFIVGAVIFTIFIVAVVWEAKEEKKEQEDYEHWGNG